MTVPGVFSDRRVVVVSVFFAKGDVSPFYVVRTALTRRVVVCVGVWV